MTLFSTATDFGNTASDTFATLGRDTRTSVGEGDLIVVMLFAALGLLLAAACVALGSGAEVGQILAVST
jgi:hypothetical protein